MDEVAGQLSQSKWEEIQKKKILLGVTSENGI